ncbi:hypothetical protein FEM48_Zijuj08G0129400 [Ziziphus jujuba var. spinosa]|uniref:Uncharacterized protein n=1 Tax=Ziziphus jujuba var. spinosa TaxID=714518 RepID=A0A978UZ83_ZIZJJ|nr:hypothetical protein FEM48_Zijuj08G0129400 [Ziziphus jujuba var. spinosa]
MGGGSSECSSSGEEDGDAEWKSAIDSIAAATTFVSSSAAKPPVSSADGDDSDEKPKTKRLKHYQLKIAELDRGYNSRNLLGILSLDKAQKILDDILERTLVIVKEHIRIPETDPMNEEGGIRLFKNAPPGIVFDHVNELQQPRKRPRLLPGKELDEKSKKFRRRLKSVAVDGEDIIAAARNAFQKSLAKFEAKDAAAKVAARREEERVAELKRIRGERWLPSMPEKHG